MPHPSSLTSTLNSRSKLLLLVYELIYLATCIYLATLYCN